MNVRWIAISLFCSGVYALGCGSDSDDKSSPCTPVCNCVTREAAETTRSDCMSQCASVRGAANPVQACRDRLAANGITTCDAACFAFGDDKASGSGGSTSTGGATSPNPSGGSNASGGSSAPTGGLTGAGGGGLTGAGGTGAGGAGGGGAPGTGGSGPVVGSPIGRACSRDADCGTGARCLTSNSSDFDGAGPPNGYCAADCTASAQACATLDPNSVCVTFGTEAGAPAFCLEGCIVGGTQLKCHNRPDIACDDSGAPTPGDGFCRPTCRGDADCGVRRCDLGSGFCIDVGPAHMIGTLPIGSPCNPTALEEMCNGVCTPLTDDPAGPGMCGGLCTLGAFGCGADPNDPGPPPAACLFPLTDAQPGRGDLGLCGQLCNCDAECTASGRACRPLPAAEAQSIGWAGYCGGAVDASGAPTQHLTCK